MTELTQERLKELLHYDPYCGEFWWKGRKGISAGTLAGTTVAGGRKLNIDTKQLTAHKVAILYMEGFYPQGKVRHIDGDRLNNSYANLLCASSTVLDQELLKKLIHYDPLTGEFTHNITCGKVRNGALAGCKNSQGYNQIALVSVPYLAHRLAFLYMEGKVPENEVDHIKGVRFDNRWENLRKATREENMRNACKYSTNTTGVTGVYRSGTRYRAVLEINGKSKSFGTFTTMEEAAEARKQGEIKYGFHENHGRAKQ